MIKRLAKAGKFLVPLVVAFFIGRTIYANWQQVRAAEWHFHAGYLLGSLLLCSVWFVGRPFLWGALLRRFGHPLAGADCYRIVRQAELSRYVPGSIWQYVSRVYLAGVLGVPATATLAATLVDTVLLSLAALLPALWNLQAVLGELGPYYRIVFSIFLVASLAIVRPRILNLWLGFVARKLKQPYRGLQIHWLALAGIWMLYVLLWLSLAAGVGLFVRGVLVVGREEMILAGSNYAIAWLISILTMIAPAGMGIRDGVMGFLLSRLLPVGTAFSLAVGVRLWLTLVELLCTAPVYWLRQGHREESAGVPEGPAAGLR